MAAAKELTADDAAMERDVRTFVELASELLEEHSGEFLLVGAADKGGLFATEDQALDEGYDRFGDRGFIVRKISSEDLVAAREWLTACQG
jgi:hypothetical protein